MNSVLLRINSLLFAALSLLSASAFAQDVAVMYAVPQANYGTDVGAKLTATGRFTSVTTIEVGLQTPSLATMQGFDAILVFSDTNFQDATLLGDNLATFADGGGGVVLATFAMTPGIGLEGRYMTNYTAMTGSGDGNGANLTLVPVVSNDVLLDNVTSFDGGTRSFHNGVTTLTPGSILVAQWSNNQPLVARRTVGTSRNVGLNFFPPSSDVDSRFWVSTSDGDTLLANALGWAVNLCGNGVPDPGEACDDGNTDNTDLCTDVCEIATCGDGFVQANVEACDDGNSENTDACLNTCVVAVCGDGFVQANVEECDDDNIDNTDACLANCTFATCGDGFVQIGVEECDDMNSVNTDGCIDTCMNATCGDGFVQAETEGCDEGADNADDGTCRLNCAVPSCGDGIVDDGESCDDGNQDDGDACLTTCVASSCGDGILQTGESCDDGDANSDAAADACRTTCVLASCGDGVIDTDEMCDSSDDCDDMCVTMGDNNATNTTNNNNSGTNNVTASGTNDGTNNTDGKSKAGSDGCGCASGGGTPRSGSLAFLLLGLICLRVRRA